MIEDVARALYALSEYSDHVTEDDVMSFIVLASKLGYLRGRYDFHVVGRGIYSPQVNIALEVLKLRGLIRITKGGRIRLLKDRMQQSILESAGYVEEMDKLAKLSRSSRRRLAELLLFGRNGEKAEYRRLLRRLLPRQ